MPPAKRTTTRKTADTAQKATDADRAASDAPKSTDSPRGVSGADESTNTVGSKNVEPEIVRNPELDGGVDKVTEARKAQEKTAEKNEKSGNVITSEKREERARSFSKEGGPTTEAYDDPYVSLAELPVNHDPVVAADHVTASQGMSVDHKKVENAAPVQISNFDDSDLSRSVMDSMSHTAGVKHTDDKGSDKSK